MTLLAVRRPHDQVQVVLQGRAGSVGPHQRHLERSTAAHGHGGGPPRRPYRARSLHLAPATSLSSVAAMSTRPKPSELFGMAPASDGTYWPETSRAPLINIALTNAALGSLSLVLRGEELPHQSGTTGHQRRRHAGAADEVVEGIL